MLNKLIFLRWQIVFNFFFGEQIVFNLRMNLIGFKNIFPRAHTCEAWQVASYKN